MNFSYDNYEKFAAMLLSFAFLTAGFYYKVAAPNSPEKYEKYNLTGTEFLNTGLSMGFGTGIGTTAISHIAKAVGGKKKERDSDTSDDEELA